MCEDGKSTDYTDIYEDKNTLFLILAMTFFILSIITVKSRQIKVKCNNLLTFRGNNTEFSVYVPFVLLFIFTVTVCAVLLFSFNSKEDSEIVYGWEPNKSRRAIDYISLNRSTTLISPQNACSKSLPPNLLIIVCSAVGRYNLRNAIRHTWAFSSLIKYNISVVFLLGVSLNDQLNEDILPESKDYHDIIVEDFIDSYNNLTLKSIMMLKWVKQNCDHVRYVMKADDDAYINIRNLARYIENVPDDKVDNFVTGKLYFKEKPIMDRKSKWYMPCYIYPEKYYPSYVCGVGYLMSMNAAMKLYNKTFTTDMIHIEDLFITGICAKLANIRPTNEIAFHFFDRAIDIECNSVHPALILVSHQVSSKSMYSLHSQIEKCTISFEDHYL